MSRYGFTLSIPSVPYGKERVMEICAYCRGYSLESQWCLECGGAGFVFVLQDKKRLRWPAASELDLPSARLGSAQFRRAGGDS